MTYRYNVEVAGWINGSGFSYWEGIDDGYSDDTFDADEYIMEDWENWRGEYNEYKDLLVTISFYPEDTEDFSEAEPIWESKCFVSEVAEQMEELEQ